MFANPPAQQIAQLLREARVIAIVGLSADRRARATAWRVPCSASATGSSR